MLGKDIQENLSILGGTRKQVFMIKPGIVGALVCVTMSALTATAQIAEPLIGPKQSTKRSACADAMDAGSIASITYLGNENLILDRANPIILCFGQQLSIDHANDATLFGDPDPLTPPGIGYVYYQSTCTPSVMGEELNLIISEGCLISTPPPPAGSAWIARGSRDGDAVFTNLGQVQDQFFGGAAGAIKFAPITVPNFNANPPSFDDMGSCVNVSTDQTFTIIYLNEITLAAFNTPDANSLAGTIQVQGGMPEWDNSTYNITLVKEGNPGVVGTIDGNISHDGMTTFSVPEAGVYHLTISDDQGCSKVFTVTVPNLDPINLCFGSGGAGTGDQFCVPVTVSNFENIVLASFAIRWDPRLFEFSNYVNVNPIFDNPSGTFNTDFTDNGLLKILNFFDIDVGSTLADNDTLFEICFTAIGPPGSESEFAISTVSEGGLDISFINTTQDNVEQPVVTKPGTLVITQPTQNVLGYSACPSGPGNVSVTFIVYGPGSNHQVDIIDENNMTVATLAFPNSNTPQTWPLAPGNYNYSLNGSLGSPIIITDESPQIYHHFENPSCFGQDNGKIVLDSITGGAGSFSTTWIGPGFVRINDDSLRDISAGDYTIIATDQNGCADTVALSLTEDTLKIGNIAKSLPECAGDATGSIAIEVFGGTDPEYNYTWANEDRSIFRNASSGSTDQVANRPGGKYYVTVTNGVCTAEDSVTLGAQKEMKIILDSMSVPSCSSDSNAFIAISVSIGINKQGPVFAWSPGSENFMQQMTSDTSAILSMLGSGTHSVTITDGTCAVDTSISILAPDPVTVEFSGTNVTQPSCPDGQDGEIFLGFSDLGGIQFDPPRAPYIFRYYDLTDGKDSLINTTSAATDLPSGVYGVYVEDARGCSDSSTIVLSSGPSIDIVLDQENVCGGDSVAQLSVTGELSGNTIAWSTGSSAETISNLKEGVYAVSVTEDIGGLACTVVDSFVIVDPTADIVIQSPMRFDVRSNCSEPNRGDIYNFRAQYSGPTDFVWHSLGDSVTSGAFISVSDPGDYPFSVIDAVTGCVLYDSIVTAAFPDPITLEVDTVHASCNGATDGAIDITATGRSGQFDYNWAGGGPNVPSRIDLAPGLYEVTVSEVGDSSCNVPLMLTIREPDILKIFIDTPMTQDIRCFGESNGQIGLEWEGGNQDMAPTITWSPGVVDNTLFADNLIAGDYDIQLTDSRGCTDMITVTITEPPQLMASFASPVEPVCNGHQTSISIDQASGGTGTNYSFSIDNGATHTVGTSAPIFAGDHLISIFDEKGCRVDTMISIAQPPPINVDLGDDVHVALGDSLRLNADVDGPSPINTYNWTPPEMLSCTDCDDPIVRPIEDQLIELRVIDDNGCEGSDALRVNVDRARLIYIPNGFTPNNDNINDKWKVYAGPGVTQILGTHVFDRWGNLVYEAGQEPASTSGTSGWDGIFAGQKMDPGVFAYLVEVEFIDGRIFTYRGDVTLIK